MIKSTIIQRTLAVAALVFFTTVPEIEAQTDGNILYSASPPSNAESAVPTVMFVMSRDHQYFFKAYNDYSDLNPELGNGVETTYSNEIDYYGYFQSDICYEYQNELFTPVELQNTEYYCDDVGGDWSGNFLNWASMTRMDVVRKVLYGGKRIVDSGTRTVLERAYLSPDSHAFVKYYNGTDIERLTPYRGFPNNGDGFDDQNEGISICNVTEFDDGRVDANNSPDANSEVNTNPPALRIAQGNYVMWTSNERVMCNWRRSDGRFNNNLPSVSNPLTIEIGGVDTGDITFEGQTFDSVLDQGEELDVSSGFDSFPLSPELSDALTDDGDSSIIVRVAACVTNSLGIVIDDESCKEYPDNGSGAPAYKPIGLLQDFSDDGSINFGLMTGSYTNNLEGGALRSNVKPFSDEVNVDTDGTFIRTSDESIVRAVDAFRIFGYGYRNTRYQDCTGNRSDVDEDENRACRSWGSPISEIYRDALLYLGGRPTPSHSDVSDDAFLADLADTPDWEVPLNADNQCSPLNTVVFNSSVNNYDSDASNISVIGLGTAAITDVNEWTNIVGAGENIDGNDYYVGATSANDDQVCTAKTVGELSEVRGVCPEGPSQEGGYALAGLAHFANQNDLYRDSDPAAGTGGLDGVQNVDTYGVALASSNPVIEVPISSGNFADQEVLLIPASVQFDGGSGALVNFQVVQRHTLIPGESNRYFGKFFVTYEVSVAGNDFDIDASGTIEYVLDESNDTITVTTTTLTESAGSTAGLFGFVIDGTTENGFHAYSGDAGNSGGANYTPPAGSSVPGCSNCRSLVGRPSTADNAQFGPRSHTFDLGTSTAEQLESPLFYASKWGLFNDINGDGTPDLDEEWDRVNNETGEPNADGSGDGLPDNFFFVTNPARLSEALNDTFTNILADTQSSGTAPANLANADGSGGLIVQALYFDTQTGVVDPNESVTWTGQLEAFFVDEFGNFREDNATQGTRFQLDGFDVDKIFEFRFDETEAETLRIVRFDIDDPTRPFLPEDPDNPNNPDENDIVLASAENVPASELSTLWSAGGVLSSYSNDDIEEQRVYTDIATNTGPSRNIITWFDTNRNRQVDPGEQIDFVRSSAELEDDQGATFGRSLTSNDDLDFQQAIIDFIRGKEGIEGLRSRVITELDAAGNEVESVQRLGDVINSTPLIVGAPDSGFSALFGDPTYDEFLRQYNNRRQVMYIGGNDGLLHAFNVGFRENSNDSAILFSTEDAADPSKRQHDLGAELWAYAPANLLPHMQWLTDSSYQHVFYVDGEPQAYDVNIFDDDEDHPNGWGTILVVGMRLGGGEFGVDLDDDNSTALEVPGNSGSNAGCEDWCARSSYIVLDITNPEEPPVLLAEINDNLRANFGNDGQIDLPTNFMQHTVSAPALIKERVPGPGVNFVNPTVNEWKLVFGNGVRNRSAFNTTQETQLYTYDLSTKVLTVDELTVTGIDTDRSFVGGLTSVDWNGDFQDDFVYFGTVGSTSNAVDVDNFKGGLFRYDVDNNSTNLMFNPDRPISVQPIARQLDGRQFLYFGTGRFFHQDDEIGSEQEAFYGVKELVDNNGVETYANNNISPTQILDTSEIEVSEDGSLGGVGIPTGVTSFDGLQSVIVNDDNIHGWQRPLPVGGAGLGEPSERISTNAAAFRSQILYTSFEPNADLCEVTSGRSFLTVVDLITGTPSSFGGLGFDANGVAVPIIPIGDGRASSPQLIVSSGLGTNRGTVIIQQDTGELKNPSITTGAEEFPERINWREIRTE